MSPIHQLDVSAEDMRDAAQLIWGCLDRVAHDQSEETAAAAAIKNVHGNVAYLRAALGDLGVLDMLGELREVILHQAMDLSRAPR